MQDPQAADAWSNGSYEQIAPNYLSLAGHVVERTGVESGDAVLDVGCGTGSVAITAARRGADVVGVDVTPSMLDGARENAAVAGVDVDWREGDATDLPFEDDTFDATLSSLGHMYGDPPGTAARELVRVTRPGGSVGFTAWTPTSLYPFMAGVVATYLAPADLPDYSEPPFAWGDSDVVEDRLSGHVADLAVETETALYPALSPEHFRREVASTSGVFATFLDAVPDEDRPALCEELVDTVRPYFDERRNAIELEYLLTTART
jgi:SAM-dependent methyltransferase